jgi:hypothetical protein
LLLLLLVMEASACFGEAVLLPGWLDMSAPAALLLAPSPPSALLANGSGSLLSAAMPI